MPRPLSSGKHPYKPLSPQRIEQILSNPSTPLPFSDESYDELDDEAEGATTTLLFDTQNQTLYRLFEYDSLMPEQHLKEFVAFLKSVQARYDENFRIVGECDLKGQDLLHKIELGDDMDVLHGYRIHKTIRNVRRQRRICKNENDLLRPLYSYLEKHDDLIPQLERLQGEIGLLKSAIDDRKYAVRTQVLKEEPNG